MQAHTPRQRPALLPSVLAAALAATFGGWASAQAQQTAGTELQSVVVTGTYAKNRTVIDSESPIDIISAKDLQGTGSTELATVLSRLLPSVNFPRPSGADGSDAVRPAQLRGLSPDQTLVLVNGKRRHASSVINVNGTQGRGSQPVDLNAIPLSAIDHIEVLRDGAAAQYGSDAIAGVVNIILKRGAAGGEAELGFGEYSKRDGKQVSLKANTGFALGDKGWLRLAVEAAKQDPTNRAGADFRTPSEPRYGQVNQRYGDPESKPKNIFFNTQYEVAEGTDFYAFGNHGERDTSAAATWRTSTRTPLYPQGFLPLENSTSTDDAIVAGVRGTSASGWRWDTSVNYGANTFDLDLDNTANVDLGLASPTHFHAGRLKNEQTLVNLDVAKDFAVAALAGPLTLAVGAEYRKEKYTISPGDPLSYQGTGSQGFSGFTPSNSGSSDRHSQSIYVNLEAQVTKQLSGGFAVRHENYSDFGSATSEKLAARFAVNDAVALRATASTGFRAPTLGQQNYTITTTNFSVINGVNTPIETGTFGVNTAAAKALGAIPLKAEKARNLSLGLQLNPVKNFTTTIDVYQIEIDDRILYSANLTLPTALKNTLAAQGTLVGAARYFTNAADTRTRGVDLVSTYRLDLAASGKLDLTLGYNHNQNSLRNIAANPTILTQNGLLLIDKQTIGRATDGSPKDKLNLAADYSIGSWTAHGGATRYGTFIVPQNSATLDQKYGAQWVLDVSGTYKTGPWRFSAGIDNLTNSYPDQTTSNGNLNTNGIYPYSVWSPAGFNGRYLYAKVAYAWK